MKTKETQNPVLTVRPEVEGFSAYSAGLSIAAIKAKYNLQNVIKLASNESPLGASPLVQKAVAKAAALAFRYPQSGNPRLVEAIANKHNLDPKQVVVANGSDEIIDLIIRLRATAGKHNVLTFKPCFSIYSLQAQFAGLELRQVPVNSDFSFPLEAFVNSADENTAVAFITTPDNPSGYTPAKEDLLCLLKYLPASCLLVVDEAYMDFCDDESKHSLLAQLNEHPNLAICRTFSKSYGLAGLRLGYALVHPFFADYLQRVRLPFSVNIVAEEAGVVALEDDYFHDLVIDTVKKGRKYLKTELEKLGCKVWDSQANFLMFALEASGPLSAAQIFELLLSRGIIIRPLKSYGLNDNLRVSVGSQEENELFIKELKSILSAN